MNKVAKGFLRALAGLAVLFFLVALLVNLYFESEGVRARLEAAVSRELRMPVTFSRVGFSFWSGLKVDGATLGSVPDGEPFLHAPRISARLDWKALLSRRLVIREVLIDSPQVVWVQTNKGKWRLPGKEEKKRGKKREKSAEERPGEHVAKAPEPGSDKSDKSDKRERDGKDAKIARDGKARETSEPAQPATAAGARAGLEFRIVQARMENASFHFLDRKGKPVAVFQGVKVRLPFAAKDEARGEAAIGKLTLRDSVVFEEVSAPFVYERGKLALPQVEARIAGGALRGSYTLEPDTEGAPFMVAVEFHDVDLNRLITEVGADDGLRRAEGKLHGALKLEGESSEEKTYTGQGRAELKQGRMEQYPLLQMLGQTLQIDELTRLELQQANLEVHVARSRVYVDRLTLDSANLNLSATGQVRFDGRLDLDAGLAVNEKIARRIPKWVYAGFRPEPESDRRRLPFAITGTLSDPETDLVRALMGEKLERQAVDLLKAFRNLATGEKKKKDSGKEKENHNEGDRR